MKEEVPEKRVIRIEYNVVKKKVSLLKEIIRSIPKPLYPTTKTFYIFIAIFILLVGWGIIQAMMPIINLRFDVNEGSDPFELKMSVGWPMQFFGTVNKEGNPKISFDFWGGLIDMVLYLFISYLIDVIINFSLTIKLGESAEELRRKPKTFIFQKKSTIDKVAEKATEKVVKSSQMGQSLGDNSTSQINKN
jgi:hypothetical protein